ncbi:phosphotransferase [Tumebacillus flagellatus]|uniref:Aminoglycoside phosphotransferase domain-containing protein n=1 Tax=Tumebacillus flagellatus TaxID=1157490 RepID=A0A074LN89_9BACL|nr:phosphotransferase [Tumebacillus flagellatus]KEO81313.1 hypothetical protein EL26_21405 [Tumebacillus flagellatus]
MSDLSKITQALQIAGLPAFEAPEKVTLLGEGAWHLAYLVLLADGREMVVRFQKKVSYGKPLVYDEKQFRSEYGGEALFYRYANDVQPGICPEEFFYHVSEELTFTVESYAGPGLKLSELSPDSAYEVGRQVGAYFRAADEIPAGVPGFGFLEWDGEQIRGSLTGDAQANLREEVEEYREDLQALIDSDLAFDRNAVTRTFEQAVANRRTGDERIVLTNRDLSPENLVWVNGRVRLIDPLPLAYSNMVFAGNFLSLYRNIYPNYHKSPRYARHNFHLYRPLLHRIADGFVDAYSDGDPERRQRIHGEQFFMLLDLVRRHLSLLEQDELSEESQIRSGNRNAIAERLPVLLHDLETFTL